MSSSSLIELPWKISFYILLFIATVFIYYLLLMPTIFGFGMEGFILFGSSDEVLTVLSFIEAEHYFIICDLRSDGVNLISNVKS